MSIKKLSLLIIILTIFPIACFADPLNGGVSSGIENFLFKVFGIVMPSIILVLLFYKRLIKNNPNFSFFIYSLNIYLFILCYVNLKKSIYLIDLRSDNTHLNGYQPDFSDEKSVIINCSIGMVIIGIIFVITIIKDVKHYKTIADKS